MNKTSREKPTDAYGRPFLNFRISVTQRCNLNCSYCHREGQHDSEDEMNPTEITRITRAAAKLGARRIKITGGEPLMRDDLPAIVKCISSIPEVDETSMVTNASLLTEDLARELRTNGLKRINVNIPSVDPETYSRLTGGDLSCALLGIRSAKTAGLHPIKINMIVLAGENDQQIDSMTKLAKTTGAVLQIIELEPLQISADYYRQRHLDLELVEKEIAERARLVVVRKHMQGRKVYSLQDIDVEIVRPVENTQFCLHCTRMRLTSDGKIKPCLMRNDSLIDLLALLQSGATDSDLQETIATAVRQRRPFYGES